MNELERPQERMLSMRGRVGGREVILQLTLRAANKMGLPSHASGVLHEIYVQREQDDEA